MVRRPAFSRAVAVLGPIPLRVWRGAVSSITIYYFIMNSGEGENFLLFGYCDGGVI